MPRRIVALFVLAALGLPAHAGGPLKVFILAGQSNMEGQAVVTMDHEQHYNGGKGNVVHVMKHSPLAAKYK
ncbi:sialate O-acetylesterase, partial [bacterium]|nr:sialate O-acetylesterase [bacterium]